ncbi:cytochrome P450 302a1, mitochondrial isoform X2 [Haematobia irritans]|uniref:cytochrome P450 302a1, mitochondrial isoform X2 n=1 Tax=Haematobia irritans TaxID=7368 RepID=UPI003F4FBD6A
MIINGAEWWRLRSELQKEISAPKSVRSFLMAVDKVTKEFLRFLPKSQDMDILPHLARLNLELTCLVTFGERLYSFSPEELDEKSRSSKLIRAAETTNSNILPTDQGLGLWRHYETGPYKKLRKAQEYMESVAVDLVSSKLVFFKDEEESIEEDPDNLWSLRRNSLVEEYMKNPNLDLFDVVGMAADLLLAGIDTTSYTTAFALYHISRHSEVQRRIYEEALTVLPSKDSPLLADSLKSGIPYTRATLKEVFRLNPISVGVGRILTKNLIFSGYHVPKNTVVVTQNMVACRLEKNFQDPFTFNPDRWLGNAKGCINPYLVLPFGHGMRSCIARRLAEQNILTFLLRLIRNYEIEWKGDNEDMDVITLLINKPSQPVTIEMKERFQ